MEFFMECVRMVKKFILKKSINLASKLNKQQQAAYSLF